MPYANNKKNRTDTCIQKETHSYICSVWFTRFDNHIIARARMNALRRIIIKGECQQFSWNKTMALAQIWQLSVVCSLSFRARRTMLSIEAHRLCQHANYVCVLCAVCAIVFHFIWMILIIIFCNAWQNQRNSSPEQKNRGIHLQSEKPIFSLESRKKKKKRSQQITKRIFFALVTVLHLFMDWNYWKLIKIYEISFIYSKNIIFVKSHLT